MKRNNSVRTYIVAVFFLIWLAVSLIGFADITFIRSIGGQLLHGFQRESGSIGEKSSKVISNIETFTNEALYGREKYIELNTAVQFAAGKREFVVGKDTVIKRDNGYLDYKYDEISVDQLEENCNAFLNLYQYCSAHNIDTLYFMTPCKTPKYDAAGGGLYQTAHEPADYLLKKFRDNHLDYVDLREELLKEGQDHYSHFFVTDHHWRPETGFWAFTKILDSLQSKMDIVFDEKITDISNYSINVYEDWFLGSQGKKVGKYFAGVDDISLILPRFETSLTLTEPYGNVELSGDFSNVLINKAQIEEKNLYNSNPSACYSRGNKPLQVITSLKSQNNKKVLILRDSFANMVTPFLSLAVEQTHVIDLREVNGQFSVYDYIEEIQPDIVLLLYNPQFFWQVPLDFSYNAILQWKK